MQLYDVVIDNVAVSPTAITELTSTESVARQMTELPVKKSIQKKKYILIGCPFLVITVIVIFWRNIKKLYCLII